MAIRSARGVSDFITIDSVSLDGKRSYVVPPSPVADSLSNAAPWTRNPSWLTLPVVSDTDEKFVGLHAVWPANIWAAVRCQGDYTVDWGDGSVINYSSNVLADHYYDSTNPLLANTNAPVTLVDAGDLVERTFHGYTNNTTVRFFNITGTTGLNEGVEYYVINATANNFQVSNTILGSAVTLTGNGSAALLPYEQAIVIITPQVGSNITLFDMGVRYANSNISASANLFSGYSTGWLDIDMSLPSLTSTGLRISTNNWVFTDEDEYYLRYDNLERAVIRNTGNLTTAQSLFDGMKNIRVVELPTTSNIANLNFTFYNCYSLSNVNLFDTSKATSMYYMMNSCFNLRQLPLFNTSNVTSFSSAFEACTSLKEFPPLNTVNGKFFSGMFTSTNLTTIPLLDTSNGSSFSNMFVNSRIEKVPLLNLSNAKTTSSMFYGCKNLNEVPLFNTSNVSDMSYMFYDCRSLRSIPTFNTCNVTSMGNMFTLCSRLVDVPLFDMSNVSTASNMFRNCTALRQVPNFNVPNLQTAAFMFDGCSSLVKAPAFRNSSNISTLENTFNNCKSLVSIELFDTSNVSTMLNTFNGCSSLATVPLFDTRRVSTFQSTFQDCASLSAVPLFNTSNTTVFANMFARTGIVESPLFNTVRATTLNNMFDTCVWLRRVPLFDTGNVTNMSGMFNYCYTLEEVPLFNTQKVTNLTNFLSYAFCIKKIPFFNTANVTSMFNAFQGLQAVTSIPEFNTSKVTNFYGAFQNMESLQYVPRLNTTAATSVYIMFYRCRNLREIPALNFNTVSTNTLPNWPPWAQYVPSLSRFRGQNIKFSIGISYCDMSKNAIEEVYTNLLAVSGQTITITGNWGVDPAVIKTVNTTAGSNVVNITNTVGIVENMFVTGTGTGISTGRFANADVATDILTLENHGFTNNTEISFGSIGTVTGVSTFRVYWVANADTIANTFQIATAPGGSIVNLTGVNSSMNVRYASYVTNIVSNTSITLSTPCGHTVTGASHTFRRLNSANALLKGWAVTF